MSPNEFIVTDKRSKKKYLSIAYVSLGIFLFECIWQQLHRNYCYHWF